MIVGRMFESEVGGRGGLAGGVEGLRGVVIRGVGLRISVDRFACFDETGELEGDSTRK